MARGDGRIYLPKDSSIYMMSFYLRGKEQRESTGKRDPVEAASVLRKRLKAVHADELGGPTFVTAAMRKSTVHDLAEALKADFELRGKASSQNLSYLKRVDTDFGDMLAVALTPEKIDRYIEERLADGAANASINRVLQLLGQAYALAIRRGHLARAPYIRRLSEAGNARQGFFTETELAAVIENLPTDLRDFVRFASLTGMRKNELASLSWKMVEGDELHIPADICKNRKKRQVPLAGQLSQIIERRRQAARIEVNGLTELAEYIFHRGGQKVGCFKKAWASACVSAGVGRMVCPKCQDEGSSRTCAQCKVSTTYDGRIFHDLRRMAVRRMVRAGINPQIAKKWSGHKSDSMFQRYSILTTDDMREAYERTEKFRETEAQKVVPIAAQG